LVLRTEILPGWLRSNLVVNSLLLLLVSQGIFWTALGIAESKGRPTSFSLAPSLSMTFADENGAPMAGAGPIEVQLNREPAYVHVDPDRNPRALFEHQFEVPGEHDDLGVLLGWNRRIMEVRLNGLPLKTQSPVDIWGILGGHDPVVYTFPSEYLRDGQNTLTFLTSGRSKKIMPEFFVGELTDLYAANTWLRMFSIDLVVVAIGVLLFAILLNTLIHWSLKERIRVRALNLLLGAWTLRNITFLGIDGGLPDPYRLLSHFVITYFFLFSFLVFTLGWTRRPLQTLEWSGIGFIVCVVVAAVATTFSEQALFDVGWWIETIVTVLIGITALLLFAEYWTRNERAETVEILLFLVCIGAVVGDALDDRWRLSVPFTDIPLTFYAAPMCGLLLALGMVASLAAQSTRARRATEDVNKLLTTKLRQQEERLNESHEREKEIEKQKVLVDERQRIIRDMHDGVGGSLMSLLLRARRNELESETLVRSLSASMSDLRLIIDSFDHVGDNLEYAMSIFRQRVEPELHASGVTLHYETSAAEAISGFGPESVLQIYRILQEACNNAVNHGDAKNIYIALFADSDDNQVRITIEDDGIGFDPGTVVRGRGLANMQHRAETLAGQIDIERTQAPRKTRVTLIFAKR
jgi:signal transduction histidine kinase